jgi:hypothetical protein
MTSAKLFILGEERELLWTSTNYSRHISWNGSPTSEINGGLLTLCFASQENDDVFWRNLLKNVDKETERMEKGEIHFYSKGERDMPTKKYKFNDAYIVYFSEIFDAESSENMQTILTISPAIQNYGMLKDFVTYWQVSQINESEPYYYRPKQEEEDTTVNINGHFYTKNGFYLGKIGSGDDVYITNELTFLELQKGKDVSKDQIIYFTEIYRLSNTQLLDRANWIFGEGRGEFADDYAHVIQNIKKWGPWGQGYKNESDMYKSMTDGKYSGKEDFFSGNTGYSTYDDFSKVRKNLADLNKLKKANIVIKAIIDQQTGSTQDQTSNATQWLGYPNTLSKNEIKKGETKTQADKSYSRIVKKYGKDKVLRRDGSGSGRSHIFYDTRPTERVKQLQNKKKE